MTHPSRIPGPISKDKPCKHPLATSLALSWLFINIPAPSVVLYLSVLQLSLPLRLRSICSICSFQSNPLVLRPTWVGASLAITLLFGKDLRRLHGLLWVGGVACVVSLTLLLIDVGGSIVFHRRVPAWLGGRRRTGRLSGGSGKIQ